MHQKNKTMKYLLFTILSTCLLSCMSKQNQKSKEQLQKKDLEVLSSYAIYDALSVVFDNEHNVKDYQRLIGLMVVCENRDFKITPNNLNISIEGNDLKIKSCEKLDSKEFYIIEFNKIDINSNDASLSFTDGDKRNHLFRYKKSDDKWIRTQPKGILY